MKAEGGWAASTPSSAPCIPPATRCRWSRRGSGTTTTSSASRSWSSWRTNTDALAGVELWHGGCVVGNLESRLPARSVSPDDRREPLLGELLRARQGRHPRDPGALRRRRPPRRSRRIRHRQRPGRRVRRDPPALPDGEVQPAHRRVRRLVRQPRAVLGRDASSRCARRSATSARSRRGCASTRSTTARSGSAPPRRPTVHRARRPLVDFWDLQAGGWVATSGRATTSSPRGSRASSPIATTSPAARTATKKPVAAVGRFTNPDTMAEAVRSGVIDIIAAARPSIADPFLPRKIEEGRYDEIRECIGCNVCASRFPQSAPIICTQNATLGEEYRRGWHPERFEPAANADRDVLVVGAGPAGMECAIGARQARHAPGSPRRRERRDRRCMRQIAAYPHLGEWGRLINYRQIQLDKLANVEVDPRDAARGRGRAHLRGRDRRHRDRLPLARRRHERPDADADPRSRAANVFTPEQVARRHGEIAGDHVSSTTPTATSPPWDGGDAHGRGKG